MTLKRLKKKLMEITYKAMGKKNGRNSIERKRQRDGLKCILLYILMFPNFYFENFPVHRKFKKQNNE